jgi:hypothetical protein
LASAFFSSFFLYSLRVLVFASAIRCFSLSSYSFFFRLSYYFWRASSYLCAKITFFFSFIDSLNYYFFLMFDSLRRSSSSFCYRFTSVSLCLSWSKVSSSSRPIELYSIYCLGLARIFFSSYLISAINSFFFCISTFSYSFFFYSTRLLYSFSSSWIFLFCCSTFSCSTFMFSLLYCTYYTNFFLLYSSSSSNF